MNRSVAGFPLLLHSGSGRCSWWRTESSLGPEAGTCLGPQYFLIQSGTQTEPESKPERLTGQLVPSPGLLAAMDDPDSLGAGKAAAPSMGSHQV